MATMTPEQALEQKKPTDGMLLWDCSHQVRSVLFSCRNPCETSVLTSALWNHGESFVALTCAVWLFLHKKSPRYDLLTTHPLPALPATLVGFMCPLSANTYGIDFLEFEIKDYDTGESIFHVSRRPSFASRRTLPPSSGVKPMPSQTGWSGVDRWSVGQYRSCRYPSPLRHAKVRAHAHALRR